LRDELRIKDEDGGGFTPIDGAFHFFFFLFWSPLGMFQSRGGTRVTNRLRRN
jgi:hypothetical protein